MEADGRVTVEASEESGGRGDLGLDRCFKGLPLIGASSQPREELLLPALSIL